MEIQLPGKANNSWWRWRRRWWRRWW